MTILTRALWCAFSWLTVVPLPHPRFTIGRHSGAHAISAVPVVGAALGAVCAAIAYGLSHTDLPSIATGAIVVGCGALATRGMHIDGLADTVDGLGCYGDEERARAVMRSGSSGPFALAAVTVVLLIESAAIAALSAQQPIAIGVAIMGGRTMAVLACRRGLPASPDGFGALVASSQRWSIPLWFSVSAGAYAAVDYHQWWRGVIAIAVVGVAMTIFSKHCARRLGGVSGDVVGAVVETSTAALLIAYCI